MPTSTDHRKQFIKAFEDLAYHRERHDVLADFLTMAVSAIRKTTLPPGLWTQRENQHADYLRPTLGAR